MSIYYEDDFVTLHHGDSLEVLPTLDVQATALLTDPPYFKVKKDAWDNQWGGADEFLGWMGTWLDHVEPLLTKNASVWVFASPQMTTAVERVIGARFRVLNSIRWVKRAGWHNRTELAALRGFMTPWEGILFAEQKEDSYELASWQLYLDTLSPIGSYFERARMASGLDRKSVAAMFPSATGRRTGCVTNWERGTHTPTAPQYERLLMLFGHENLPLTYQEILELRANLGREYDNARSALLPLRRPFSATDRALSTDVWDFPTVKSYKGKHPCEKPAEMLRHMIETSTRESDLILDPFAGSGSTLEAARNLGRRAIGIEQDEHWCEQIANRLSQGRLDLLESA